MGHQPEPPPDSPGEMSESYREYRLRLEHRAENARRAFWWSVGMLVISLAGVLAALL